MKADDVNLFNRVKSQLQELHGEMSVLSKGKPDNPINAFKLKFINEKLEQANTLLTGDFKPFKEFSNFEDGALPSNSDVVMILSQYLNCLEGWRSAHVHYIQSTGWLWAVNDEKISAIPPTVFRKA